MGHPWAEKQRLVQDERARRMVELATKPILTLAEISLYTGLPISTLHKLRSQGKGPPTFNIGRIVYATHDNLHGWIADMAKVSPDH